MVPSRVRGVWVGGSGGCAAQQHAGACAGGRAVAERDLAVAHGEVEAVGALHDALRAGGQVAEHLGQVQVHAENLAKQRESALALIANYPNAEKIRFTQDGDRPGLGASWRVNAIVTIGGKDYQEILGPRSRAGESLPDAPPPSSTRPVTVTYSDGSSEVLG